MRSDMPAGELVKTERHVNSVLAWMRTILKDENFATTRFSKKADFYTLFGVLADFRAEKWTVSKDARLNRRAREVLISFSREANKIDGRVKKYRPANSQRKRGTMLDTSSRLGKALTRSGIELSAMTCFGLVWSPCSGSRSRATGRLRLV